MKTYGFEVAHGYEVLKGVVDANSKEDAKTKILEEDWEDIIDTYDVEKCTIGYLKVKAKIGSWITLTEWKYDKEKDAFIPICVKTEQVDGKKIKEDTYYELIHGKFVEVDQETYKKISTEYECY